MSVKKYKPTTPGRRGMTTSDTSAITGKRSKKNLLVAHKPRAGRNNQGRITVRHRSGGVKRFYRLVDFKLPEGTKGTVTQIEYDPNRSANIALLELEDGTFKYILAGSGMEVGDKIESGQEVEVKAGNRMPLRVVPVGSFVYNIEQVVGKGGQFARSAGTKAQVMAKEGEYAFIRMPSGEVRLIHVDCFASIGTVGNAAHQNIKIGSAGRNRRKGKRPSVTGKSMNPSDHPMGGGEGKTGPGRLQKTPWGKTAMGKKTRRRKSTNKLIVRDRRKGRRK